MANPQVTGTPSGGKFRVYGSPRWYADSWMSDPGGIVRRLDRFIRLPHSFVFQSKCFLGMYSAIFQAPFSDLCISAAGLGATYSGVSFGGMIFASIGAFTSRLA